jgi:hypothetical protein
MRKRSLFWTAALVLPCVGALSTGCKKTESTEYGAEPSAAATPTVAVRAAAPCRNFLRDTSR